MCEMDRQAVLEAQETICELREEIDRLNHEIDRMDKREQWMDGMIAGLKFAIKCDGVSGGEVE